MSEHTILETTERKEQLIRKLNKLGYQKPITDNLTLIKFHTSDLSALATRFVEVELLAWDEKQNIMENNKPESEKAEKLFMAAMKHGDWKKVIDALVKTKNSYIIKKLQAYVNANPEPPLENQRTDRSNMQEKRQNCVIY